MPVDRQELDRALDKGGVSELPPNIPPGMLGEVAPDLRKADDFKPTLNAGLLQESSPDTRFLTLLLLFLLVVTAPAALWLLWSDRNRRLWAKVAGTALALVFYVAIWVFTKH